MGDIGMFCCAVWLVLIIAIVYKSIKLPQITAYKLVREVIVLSGTIIIFMTLIAFWLIRS